MTYIAEYYLLDRNTFTQIPIEADSREQATDMAESYLNAAMELVNVEAIGR